MDVLILHKASRRDSKSCKEMWIKIRLHTIYILILEAMIILYPAKINYLKTDKCNQLFLSFIFSSRIGRKFPCMFLFVVTGMFGVVVGVIQYIGNFSPSLSYSECLFSNLCYITFLVCFTCF